MDYFVFLILGLAFCALGGVTLIQHYFFSSDFKLTKGKLLKADVKSTKSLGAVELEPDVEYEYYIGGKTLRGTKIYSNVESEASLFPFGRLDAKIYSVRKLRPDSEVQVFYNPQNPSESYLKLAGLHFSVPLSIIFLALGASVVAFEIYFFIRDHIHN